MKAKRIYDEYKKFFVYGKKFLTKNPNLCMTICKYATDELTKKYHSDKSIFNENERAEFMKELTQINKIEATVVDELEYNEFLENMFANVDDEDREGTVTEATAYKFNMLAVLIDVIKTWNPDVTGEWAAKKKYCKYKAVDITKSLKNGEVPKRGGPMEQKKKEEEENKNNLEDHTNPDTFNQNFTGGNTNNNNNNFNGNNGFNGYNNNNKFNDFNNNNNNFNKTAPNINNDINNNKNNLNLNDKPSNSNPNIKQQTIKIPNKDKSDDIHRENSENSKLKLKKLNVELPVKNKSVDYFRVIDFVRSNLKSSSNELGRSNIKNCTEYLENCLYYYNNIQ